MTELDVLQQKAQRYIQALADGEPSATQRGLDLNDSVKQSVQSGLRVDDISEASGLRPQDIRQIAAK